MKMPIPFLDLSLIDRELKSALERKFSDMLSEGIFSGGKEVELLEKNLCLFLDTTCAIIPCSNGTDALEIALRAIGIGKNDEVIVPALTWVSTAEAVSMVGATPVFIDTDSSGLMNLELLDSALSPMTKAVIGVHLYGKMLDMEKLVSWSKSKGIKVIEDNAQAFGAIQKGKSAGCFADIGCLSFYPTKNLGALGEAGALITQDEQLAMKIRMLINHGQISRDHHEILGRNARIDTIQAGFLNVKMSFFQTWQQKRKTLAGVYLKKLSGVGDIILPETILAPDHNAHLFVIQSDYRDALRQYLENKGIGTAIHYPTIVPKMKPYSFQEEYKVSEKLSKTVLSLPLNPFLEENDIKNISAKIKNFYSKIS
ncbi:DegT/DnrJ/EryC1/StrS family aminotransferase [Aquiflexum sp. XJ19-11]|uniref:DegT/DnrJ/EryC1/StrS family aminotransferase n=2 Tax=Aquiflexum gelatinilyticum TaxID=2961943 RepID=A0A9X2P3V6_9BACT|nr:DegT/DnrJ/EryC1/StrS family aminotransferase [Aquiflexum gelatinilyticum]MCR9015383.1 DegT/DnrJ/EryC1/StrS family aminotransferase [Aquiflexum gelatinilyticum]